MKTLLIVSGPSLSGKTTLIHRLLATGQWHQFKTTTTRPQRSTDDHEYHFATPSEFAIGEQTGDLIAPRKFKVANGDIWSYGVSQSRLLAATGNQIFVLDWHGYDELKTLIDRNQLPLTLKLIYLKIPLKTRFERALQRDTDFEETLRRMYHDEFEDFPPSNPPTEALVLTDKTPSVATINQMLTQN